MAFHIFRRQAVYYWRHRTPRVLAKVLGRQHLSMSLQTTNRAAARRLVTQVNLFFVAMLADGTDKLSRSQIETMLHAVVEKQVTKLAPREPQCICRRACGQRALRSAR